MPKKFKVPATVKTNAKLFLDSVEDTQEELLGLSNITLAERLAEGEIDEHTFNALESFAESINWNSKLHGRSPESNALLSIGGRATKSFIKDTVIAIETAIDQDINGDLQPDGSYIQKIRIVSPGLGSTGYYSEEALRASESAFPKGTNMLNSHVRQLERVQKAGLKMDDIYGETIEDARFENHPTEGPGLYTRIRVFPKVVERLGIDVVKKSQFSIYTRATFEKAKRVINGRLVPVVKKLINTRTTSVDAVMVAGRGGRFVAESEDQQQEFRVVVESANLWLDGDGDSTGGTQLVVFSPVEDETLIEKGTDGATKENTMTLEEAKALIEVLKAEKAQLVTAQESHDATVSGLTRTINGYKAVEAVRESLGNVTFTSKEAQRLVVESILAGVKFDDEGNVDNEALGVATEAYTSGASELVVTEKADGPNDGKIAAESDDDNTFFTPPTVNIGQVAETFSAPNLNTGGSSTGGNSDAGKNYLAATKDIKF